MHNVQVGLYSLLVTITTLATLPVICWSEPSESSSLSRAKRSVLVLDDGDYYDYYHPRNTYQNNNAYLSNLYPRTDDVTLRDPDVFSSVVKKSARSRLLRNFRSGKTYILYLCTCMHVSNELFIDYIPSVLVITLDLRPSFLLFCSVGHYL